MSSDKRLEPPQVEIGLSAKAEAKLEVTTEIPSEASGRLLDALTDIIRPFSERRGLRADQIRLQREEVALKVARKAKERISLESGEVQGASTKVLVPLLEAASLEDITDEEMQGRWANLLASAVLKNDVEPRFVTILSEIQGSQAKLLDEIATRNAKIYNRPIAHLSDAPTMLSFGFTQMVAQEFDRNQRLDLSIDQSIEEFYNHMLQTMNIPGCAIIDILVYVDDSQYNVNKKFRVDELKFNIELEILSSIGLLQNNNQFIRLNRFDVHFVYYSITDMGVRFFKACSGLEDEPI